MASGFKWNFIADVANFLRGTKDVGESLEDVADSLDDVKREGEQATEQLERSFKDAADAAEKMGKDADGAFDRLAKGAKKADDEVDRAKQGMGEFKDEAGSTGREAAASFSGSFDDVSDTVQEVAANAFAGFGPAGAAAGIAAAVGIGFAVAEIQAAKERVKELAETLIDTGGNVGTDDIFERIKNAAVEGDLEALIYDAKRLGVAVNETAVAFSGDSDAINRYVRELEDLKVEQSEVQERIEKSAFAHLGSRNAIVANNDAATRLIRTIKEQNRETEKAEEIARQFQEVTGITLETLQNLESALQELAGPTDDLASATEAAAQRQAAATKSTEDSWKDYADTAVASIDDVIAAQERDIQASLNFQANAEKVFAAVGQAGVDWALAQGENADKAMQLLANAPKNKQKQVVSNYTALGQQSGIGLAQGLTDQKPAVIGSAAQLHNAVKAEMAKRGKVQIPLGVNGANLTYEARLALAKLQAYYDAHPVTIPVRQGQRPIRDVP